MRWAPVTVENWCELNTSDRAGAGGEIADAGPAPAPVVWNATTWSWTDAGDLRPGEALLGHGGPATVTTVDRYTGSRIMHNLTVADLHTLLLSQGRRACGLNGRRNSLRLAIAELLGLRWTDIDLTAEHLHAQ